MSRARRASSRSFTAADLTPMVDVVFLLIVFFILVSQLTRTERAPIALPALEADLLSDAPTRERLVVHVEPGALRVGAARLPLGADAQRDLAAIIRRALDASPGAAVVIRAPRDAPYRDVAPALAAAADAEAPDVRLIAREIPPGAAP